MALRLAKAATCVAESYGLRRLSIFSNFTPPTSNSTQQQRPQAEPSNNLFISGLNKRTTTETLRDCFAKYGELQHCRVVTDRVNGYSKGFGFVRYATVEEAAAAIEAMDGKYLDAWVIFVEYAKPKPPPGQENNQNSSNQTSLFGRR